MKIDKNLLSPAEQLALRSPSEQAAFLKGFSKEELKALEYQWRGFLARPSQLAPDNLDWTMFLICAGRGFGKTRSGAEFIREEVNSGRARRIILAGPTAADVRDIMLEGESGLLNIYPLSEIPKYEPSKRRITWKNGATAVLVSADEPDRFRGLQCDTAWCDELASWKSPEAFDMLRFGMRLGKSPRCVITTTPKPTPLVRNLLKESKNPDAVTKVIVRTGSTYENQSNLSSQFFQQTVSKYEGTRLGMQEIYAQVLEDVEGALWSANVIDECRVKAMPCAAKRVVVAIDPAVSSGEASDETGIVVAALGEDNHGYLLADISGRFTPNVWARKAVRAFASYHADRIIAEVNNGGELVGQNIRTVDATVPFKAVNASRGKRARAEPISALYEQKRIHHVGVFPELEEQLCVWDPIGDVRSPDRMDAMVWAFSELMMIGRHRRDFSLLPPM